MFSDRYIALGKWVKGVAASIAIIVKKNCIWKIVVGSLVVGAMQCNKKRLRHASEIKYVKFGF